MVNQWCSLQKRDNLYSKGVCSNGANKFSKDTHPDQSYCSKEIDKRSRSLSLTTNAEEKGFYSYGANEDLYSTGHTHPEQSCWPKKEEKAESKARAQIRRRTRVKRAEGKSPVMAKERIPLCISKFANPYPNQP